PGQSRLRPHALDNAEIEPAEPARSAAQRHQCHRPPVTTHRGHAMLGFVSQHPRHPLDIAAHGVADTNLIGERTRHRAHRNPEAFRDISLVCASLECHCFASLCYQRNICVFWAKQAPRRLIPWRKAPSRPFHRRSILNGATAQMVVCLVFYLVWWLPAPELSWAFPCTLCQRQIFANTLWGQHLSVWGLSPASPGGRSLFHDRIGWPTMKPPNKEVS